MPCPGCDVELPPDRILCEVCCYTIREELNKEKMPCEVCGLSARNRLCDGCLKGAKAIHALLTTKSVNNSANTVAPVNSSASRETNIAPLDLYGFTCALRQAIEMKEKLNYFNSCLEAFKNQEHKDILVKPGNNDGPSIAAHRSLLSATSEIFKFMLDSDGCKAPPSHEITLAELSYPELHALIDFLYLGELPKEKLEKHIYSLSVAADKYEIKFLQKYCEQHMLSSLNASNALDLLEISDTHTSYLHLKTTAMNFIVENIKEIVFTPKFDAFTVKNPHLAVEITRISFAINIKK